MAFGSACHRWCCLQWVHADVQNDLTKGLGFIKGLLGVEIYHMSDTLFVAVARYETKTTMDAAAPKIGKVLGGIKAMLAGKPEVEKQRVIWNFDGAGTNNAKAALRIMTIPITSTATEEAVLEIAQGDALQRGMKSLTGLISGEVIFYEGDKMITMTKYVLTPPIPPIHFGFFWANSRMY